MKINGYIKINAASFRKPVLAAILAFCALFPAFAQNSFSKGEAIFLDNKPQEALPFLEAAVNEDPAHVQAFIYLGIAYQQLNRTDDAIAVYQKILPRGGSETAKIAFNLGNAYFNKGNYSSAVDSYTQALNADPSYSTALLNRANSKIKTGALKDAVTDYQNYLVMEPQSSQRGQIEKLISFINDEFAAEAKRIEDARIAEEKRIQDEKLAEEKRQEDARIAEEQRKAEEEKQRIAQEEAARAESERRQRLLDEVSASLQAAAEESKGLSAGNEEVQGYDGEFELE
ncbi:MAG: tetratricopeptide repeat protein [Treponema sp.]|nr:tetratricopeptide repeat protein [Treponema sp.]